MPGDSRCGLRINSGSAIFVNLKPVETFDITINHRGESRTFRGRFNTYGFSYRFIVEVNGIEVIYEPDEERNLRAVVLSAKRSDDRLEEVIALVGEELKNRLSS
jgi:hypothetical protein